MQTLRLTIGLRLGAILLLVSLTLGPGFAEDAGSGAHADGKAAAPSGEPSGSRSPAGDNVGAGRAQRDAHAPRGDDGKNHEGTSPGGNEAAKDANPSVPGANDSGAGDTNIAPSRHLDRKSNKIGPDKSTNGSVLTRNLYRRMLSVPRTPNRPVRNAIGVPVLPHERVERHDNLHPDVLHPGTLSAPHNSPGGTTVAPGNVGSRLTRIEGGAGRHAPNANPIVAPAAANRGAVSGTGLMHRNLGPSQIGGPKASVAGINGTTIRPKH
jgi:hypothetical protein